MSSAQPDPKYFTYSTYSLYKEKFNPDRHITYDVDKLNDFIKKSINVDTQQHKYKYVFEELLRHLANTGAFLSYNTDDACKYVSYILRKEIQKVDKEKYYDNIFSIFQKFAQAFKVYKKFKNDLCEKKMFDINSNEFPKMKALYDIYDMYYKIKVTPDHQKKERCIGLADLIREYNYALKTYDDSDDYVIEKLLHIKDLTKELNVLPRESCIYQLSELKSPILYLYRKEKEELAQKEKLKREQELAQQERDKQEERSTLESSSLLSGTQDVFSMPENDASPPTLKKPEEGEPSIITVPPRDLEYVDQTFTDTQLFSLGSSREKKEILDPSGVRIYAPENSGDKHGVTPRAFGSITDTISGFIKEVDPAPVLGVSGGMGVLFILFKYTPFGSFFGGRRRRMHQIPSSFRGFPPDFANFHEYEGGHIGYGPMGISPLAE